MEKKKSLRDLSWQVDEGTYRRDRALSYSILSKYEREGFSKLDSLFEPITTASLTLGSCVDAWITGGYEEFEERFVVTSYPKLSDNLTAITKELFHRFGGIYEKFQDLSDTTVSEVAKSQGFWQADKWDGIRARKVKEENGCHEYYRLLKDAHGKTVIDKDTYDDVVNMVNALKDSKATEWYFMPDNPFDNMERLYQLKFRANFNGVDYRNMADLIIVDHNTKIVIPCDLKTTGHPEYEFADSFRMFNYHIQARLYWRIIRHAMDMDNYFKDFELQDYKFIVVNKKTLDPLVWTFPDTKKYGELCYGKDKNIICRDPFDIGKELFHYLIDKPKRPDGVLNDNDITKFLNAL